MRPVVLLLFAACSDANATLDELSDFKIGIVAMTASDIEPTPGMVFVDYDETEFREARGECPVFDDALVARINGHALDVTSYGGELTDPPFNCYGPRFSFAENFTADRSTSFSISDGSLTITAEYAPEAFEPHTATLISGTTWRFPPGKAVVVAWSHPLDFVLGMQPRFTFANDAKQSFEFLPTFAGDEIHFTVPNPAPVTGPGAFVFSFGFRVTDATTCTNAIRCGSSASDEYSHSAEIID